MDLNSIFTHRVVVTRDVPHDPTQSVTFRKLAPRLLEAAAKEAQRQSIEDVTAAGGPKLVGEIQREFASDKKKDEIAEAVTRDPLLTYDRVTLLEKAVQSWTYPEPATRESFLEIDETTLQWLATEILRLSKPSLYETEADRKNG
jgi:hypothetical protein